MDGEARRLVEQAGAGVFVPPENVGELVDAVRRLAAAPERLEAMDRSGRRYVLNHYDRKSLARSYLDLLRSLRAEEPPSAETQPEPVQAEPRDPDLEAICDGLRQRLDEVAEDDAAPPPQT